MEGIGGQPEVLRGTLALRGTQLGNPCTNKLTCCTLSCLTSLKSAGTCTALGNTAAWFPFSLSHGIFSTASLGKIS
jgi:hypothetical protein